MKWKGTKEDGHTGEEIFIRRKGGAEKTCESVFNIQFFNILCLYAGNCMDCYGKRNPFIGNGTFLFGNRRSNDGDNDGYAPAESGK